MAENNNFFCSTLSEFENFLLCERILINVKTKRQANFKDFKRFGAFKGLVEQKNVVFNSFVCKLGLFWHEWAILKRECLFAEQMTFDIYGLETTFSETKARTRLLFERTFLLQKQFFFN
jgi:hypothetical protein